MTPDRRAESVGQFAEAMPAHEASPWQVRLAAIDMSGAYQKGEREHPPEARMVFDRFHVMQLAGMALDEVRRQLQRQGVAVKGAMWALRGNEDRLSEKQLHLRKELCARHKELGRAMEQRESCSLDPHLPSLLGVPC